MQGINGAQSSQQTKTNQPPRNALTESGLAAKCILTACGCIRPVSDRYNIGQLPIFNCFFSVTRSIESGNHGEERDEGTKFKKKPHHGRCWLSGLLKLAGGRQGGKGPVSISDDLDGIEFVFNETDIIYLIKKILSKVSAATTRR